MERLEVGSLLGELNGGSASTSPAIATPPAAALSASAAPAECP
jgi:hypothetical protein